MLKKLYASVTLDKAGENFLQFEEMWWKQYSSCHCRQLIAIIRNSGKTEEVDNGSKIEAGDDKNVTQ